MKKLFLILSALAIVITPAYALDDASFRDVIRLNADGGSQGEATRVIKLVRFASRDADTASLASGDAVRYSLISDDGVTVEKTFTSADGAFAGIVAMTIPSADGSSTSLRDDIGRRNWGWIVVNGPTTATVSAGGTNNNAAGDRFYTSRDAGKVAGLEEVSLSADLTTPALWRAHVTNQLKKAGNSGGFFMDAADGSSTSVDVYVENV